MYERPKCPYSYFSWALEFNFGVLFPCEYPWFDWSYFAKWSFLNWFSKNSWLNPSTIHFSAELNWDYEILGMQFKAVISLKVTSATKLFFVIK